MSVSVYPPCGPIFCRTWRVKLARPESIRFEIRRYRKPPSVFENDLVAQLPGLLITQFQVPPEEHPYGMADSLALRFDFTEEWYSVIAFLNADKSPTGYYRIFMQSPLRNEEGVRKSYDLVLGIEAHPNGDYMVTGEEDFCAAVDES